MSYLKLIRGQMQNLAETVASVLNVEVAIADKNLARVVGTGDFHSRLDEHCADDSLFAKVLETGNYVVNLDRSEFCSNCSHRSRCTEFANMSYPIMDEDDVIGVVSFASFDDTQTDIIKLKIQEYFDMLRETAWIVEQEITNVKITNRLNNDVADINEIINCLNKGIIILNSDKEILHINSKALNILKLSLSEDTIISTDIEKFIRGITYEETRNDKGDKISLWKINNKDTRVIYNISKIKLNDNESGIFLSFDIMEELVNITKSYKDKIQIRFEDIIGNSDPMLKSIEKSKIAAKTDSTILLKGDTGTGKELFARSIHNESLRQDGPFIAINCASLPENLIESELFGYEKGAFTGANLSGKKGKIELANNGTLFLDEIGDLPLHLQTKLLRVLQEKTIDRLGGEKPIHVNIRIISATNKDLVQLVKDKKFRLDLYYRLNVIPIELPRLKDRGEDVFLCSDHIIDRICHDMRLDKKQLSPDVIKLFKQYPWYGNVRELENVLEHGICFSTNGYIESSDLPDYFLNNDFSLHDIDKNEFEMAEDKNLDQMINDYEREIISQLIKKYGDHTEGKKMVAEKLGIGLTTLYRKMNE